MEWKDRIKALYKHGSIRWSFISLDSCLQVVAAELPRRNNLCQLASATNDKITLPLDESSDDKSGRFMTMRGMTAKNFDPTRYAGRWFEVASLKRGFAGQGQADCHCTQVNAKSGCVIDR